MNLTEGGVSYLEFVSTISQTIDTEFDQENNCKNYPTENYESFRDCDDEFVKKEVTKTGLIPFWVTKNYSSVTKLR